MKSSFSVNIYLTSSKFLGYAIFTVGAVFAFLYKDPNIFIFSSSIAGGLCGLKTWRTSMLDLKKTDNGVSAPYEEKPEEPVKEPAKEPIKEGDIG